jgi:hypothetical protein
MLDEHLLWLSHSSPDSVHMGIRADGFCVTGVGAMWQQGWARSQLC